MPKIKPLFAWYDLWVGFFWDRKSRKLYVLPIPMVGVVLEFPQRPEDGTSIAEPQDGREDIKLWEMAVILALAAALFVAISAVAAAVVPLVGVVRLWQKARRVFNSTASAELSDGRV